MMNRVSRKQESLDDALKLAHIVEVVGSDASALSASSQVEIPDSGGSGGDSRHTIEERLVSTLPGGVSEHLTLLNILNVAADRLVSADAFAQRTGNMSHAFWSSVAAKVHNKRMDEVKANVSTWLSQEAMINDESFKRATSMLETIGEAIGSTHPPVAQVLYAARLYHLIVPCERHQGQPQRQLNARIAFDGRNVKCTRLAPIKPALNLPTHIGLALAQGSGVGVAESFIETQPGAGPQPFLFTPFPLIPSGSLPTSSTESRKSSPGGRGLRRRFRRGSS